MTVTDSATPSDSPFLGSPDVAAEYLEAAYAELARIIDEAMRAIVAEAIATFDPHNVVAMVAAGDPAAFDAMHPAWQTIVDDEIAPVIGRVYADTALTAVLTSTAPPHVSLKMLPVVNEAAVDYTRQATNRIVGAGQNLWTSVRSELTQAVQQGSSTEDLKSTIERITGYSEFRSDTIARTETLMAYNHGDNETARHLAEYGPVEKEWLATTDNRTRESHIEANGQVVKFDDDFLVGGNYMPFPGQGPPEETINCRCVTLHYYDGDPRSDGSIVGEDDNVQAAPSASDQEINDFIREQLAANPNMTTQELLDAYKATGKSVARQRFYGIAREAKGAGPKVTGVTRPKSVKAVAEKATKAIEKEIVGEARGFTPEMSSNMNRARQIARDAEAKPWSHRLSNSRRIGSGKTERFVYDVSEQGRELNKALVDVGEEVQKRAATYTNWDRESLERLHKNRGAFSGEYKRARAEYEDAQRRALSELRDMGKGKIKVDGATLRVADMESAAKEYPTEWVKGQPKYTVSDTGRGYHDWQNKHIALSGNSPAGYRSTAVHELGHGMEQTVPGLRHAEHSFFWERAERGGLDNVWEDVTAKGKEIGYKDEWYNQYAGRVYNGAHPTSPYEVFTMGVEQEFGGWSGRMANGMMDPEYERWILGVMASL